MSISDPLMECVQPCFSVLLILECLLIHLFLYAVGVDFLEKNQFIPSLGDQVTLMLWDTAGQEVRLSSNRYVTDCIP